MGKHDYDDGYPTQGDDLPRSSAAINRLQPANRYLGVETKDDDGDVQRTQFDDVFEAINVELSTVSEALHLLEDKLGPYLQSLPSAESGQMNGKDTVSDRSAFFVELSQYPSRIRRLRMHVESIYERVDR